MAERDHEKAKSTVLSVLSDKAVNKIDFGIGVWDVKPQLYRSVADAIRHDKIAVIHDPDLRKVKRGGVYVMKLDLLGVASATIHGTAHQQLMTQQLIIHECTHAGFDIGRQQLMSHLESEAAAYLAGYLFLVAKVASTGKNADKYWVDHADPAERKVIQTALQIAKKHYYGRAIPNKLYFDLEAGIRASPIYKDIADDIIEHDGVGPAY